MRNPRPAGFTLLELMIVVAVIAILAMIAFPMYTEQVRKGRRADAARAVGQLQLEMERWRAENPCYGQSAVAPCPTFTASGTYPVAPTSNFYTIALSGQTLTDYTITATPAGAQVGDRCGNLVANLTDKKKPTWATASCN